MKTIYKKFIMVLIDFLVVIIYAFVYDSSNLARMLACAGWRIDFSIYLFLSVLFAVLIIFLFKKHLYHKICWFLCLASLNVIITFSLKVLLIINSTEGL